MKKYKWYAGFSCKGAVLFSLAVMLSANVPAQNAAQLPAQDAAHTQLTIEQAVELALKNNLGLESSRIGLATKKRASDLSWNQFIPGITVAGVLNRSNEIGKAEGLHPVEQLPLNPLFGGMIPSGTPNIYGVVPYSVELPEWSIAANVQIQLALSASMFENMNRLRLDYETGLISYEKAKVQHEREVRKTYHNILLLQENIALIRGSFENVERQVQMAQANYNAGLAPELVLLQARVARENMRPMIDQAENGLISLKALFAMHLGLDSNTSFELVPLSDTGDFIPLDVEEMISKAAQSKPDIMELRQQINMLQSVRKIQVLSLTPSLVLGWNSTSAFLKDPWKDPWFGSSDDWKEISGAFSITFALRLHSLIPYSQDFQGIRNAEDQLKTANIGLAQMIRGTEIDVQNIVLSLERTHTNMRALAQNVTLAEQSYRLMEQAYRAGLQDYFQVQSSELSLRQARNNLLEQQFTYLNGLIDLEYSIGVPFGTLSKRSQ